MSHEDLLKSEVVGQYLNRYTPPGDWGECLSLKTTIKDMYFPALHFCLYLGHLVAGTFLLFSLLVAWASHIFSPSKLNLSLHHNDCTHIKDLHTSSVCVCGGGHPSLEI